MQRTTYKTLVLLIQLLMVVAAYQYLAWATPVQAEAVWLDDEPDDPNQVEPDEPMPEGAGCTAAHIWLDEEPDDPNQVEPDEPMPECVGCTASRIWLDDEPDDPNQIEPDEPMPETA